MFHQGVVAFNCNSRPYTHTKAFKNYYMYMTSTVNLLWLNISQEIVDLSNHLICQVIASFKSLHILLWQQYPICFNLITLIHLIHWRWTFFSLLSNADDFSFPLMKTQYIFFLFQCIDHAKFTWYEINHESRKYRFWHFYSIMVELLVNLINLTSNIVKEEKFLPSWKVENNTNCFANPVSTNGASGHLEAMIAARTSKSFLNCLS